MYYVDNSRDIIKIIFIYWINMGSICDICEDDEQDIIKFKNLIHNNRCHMNDIA